MKKRTCFFYNWPENEVHKWHASKLLVEKAFHTLSCTSFFKTVLMIGLWTRNYLLSLAFPKRVNDWCPRHIAFKANHSVVLYLGNSPKMKEVFTSVEILCNIFDLINHDYRVREENLTKKKKNIHLCPNIAILSWIVTIMIILNGALKNA